MSGVEAWQKFQASSPNAPNISYSLYRAEKFTLAGFFFSIILYGVFVVLFFQCIFAVFNPINRTRTSKRSWWIVAYVVAIFLLAAVAFIMTRIRLSSSYIDNRGFPGGPSSWGQAGPLEYFLWYSSEALTGVSEAMSVLIGWLVDGVLIYRCWIIYGGNHWAVAFPCLLYLASVATNIVVIFHEFFPQSWRWDHATVVGWYFAYLGISLTHNVLLTFMIIARLAFHHRNMRTALGASGVTDGLYKSIITMLIESYSFYAAAHLAYLASLGTDYNSAFGTIFPNARIISTLLVVYRVANRTALTSEDVVYGSFDSIRFRSQGESTDGGASNLEEVPANSVEANGEAPSEPHRQGAENEIEEVPR